MNDAGGKRGDGFDRLSMLITRAADVESFRDEPVPRALLDEVIARATAWWPPRFAQPPWRIIVVVGEERERLVGRVAEALARHWGLGALGPRGLASEAVLNAPALVLVFSTISSSEGTEAFGVVAGAVQNLLLLARARGLGTHRIFSAHVVPEATLDFAAEFLGPEIRGGELAIMLAVGWPEVTPEPRAAPPVHAHWVGTGDAPATPPAAVLDDLKPPAQVLRSPRRERVLVADPYSYNRAMLEALLTRGGYSPQVFSDGKTLLDAVARDGDPDLFVIADRLPDTSGVELVRRIQHGGAYPAVIVTTARRDSAFRIAGLSAGVDYYLRKPVNAVELFTAARILLERRRLVSELHAANAALGRAIGELRAAQARLVQHAKMAALGQLVAGVAHEINTPLAAVVNNNEVFLRVFARLHGALDVQTLGETAQRDLRAVEELLVVTRAACERITGIVRTLRTFARLDEADVKAVDLHEGIESTLVLVAHLLKGGITVERRYGELPRVECHPNQVNQVFMNLLVNACQAMGDTGKLTITTRTLDGDMVEVRIADSGHGIPAEKLARIFDPGFTTKGAHLGTGLGLSIVYQIVEGHGGEIVVESEAGHGAEFIVRLPVRHVRPGGVHEHH
jgi:signal transduction histidine kinase/nitroreductase